MKLVLAYHHYFQFYVGGLMKRAAKRLGFDVVSVGPKAGPWTPAPPEDGWEPDVEVDLDAPEVKKITGGFVYPVGAADAVVTIDQSTGFYVAVPPGMPHAIVQTESNPGEVERALEFRPDALWSLMPTKESAKYAGVLPLEWGYDNEHTPLTDPGTWRPIDFVLRGTPSPYRDRIRTAVTEEIRRSFGTFGPPVTRAAWGAELREAKITLCDHDEEFVSGRVVDAVAAGCLVLAKPSKAMDMLLPRGYVPVRPGADGWPDVDDVVAKVRHCLDHTERCTVVRRGQSRIRWFTWDNQLLRVLGSIGVRP